MDARRDDRIAAREEPAEGERTRQIVDETKWPYAAAARIASIEADLAATRKELDEYRAAMRRPRDPARLPNLARTAEALKRYDRADQAAKETDWRGVPRGRASEIIARLEILAEDVGRQFGLDTADRNDPDACTRMVRPCHRNNPGGKSFVRRMVEQWEAEASMRLAVRNGELLRAEARAAELEALLRGAMEFLEGVIVPEVHEPGADPRIDAIRAALKETKRERYEALSVDSKEGLLCSEWVSRTGAAEARRDRAEARAEELAGLLREVGDYLMSVRGRSPVTDTLLDDVRAALKETPDAD